MSRSDMIRLLIGDVVFVAVCFTLLIRLLIGDVVFFVVCFPLLILVDGCIRRRCRQNNSSTVTSSSPSPEATAELIASVIIEIEQLKRIQELSWAIVGEEGVGESAADCCVICSEEFKARQRVRILLPNCAHRFHINCIDEWLMLQPFCPLCRRRVFTL